jgi:hypothetical protein
MDIHVPLNNGIDAINGGRDAVAPQGTKYQFLYHQVSTAPATNDRFSVTFTDSGTQVQVTVGEGDLSGVIPTFCFTYGNKVYMLAGSLVYFSAVGDATVWNDLQALGNGNVEMSNYFATPESLMAIAPFQGKLAFLSRSTVQIWQVASDPLNWQQVQILQNIGTIAPQSVQPKGDLDLLFLHDSGIRSLRARETSLNAFVDDLGSPVDSLVQASIRSAGSGFLAANKATAVVEPQSGRYWLHLNGVIYVFSYFPSAKIAAWSQYEPIDSLGHTFIPEKFVIYGGQVYVRGIDQTTSKATIYRYGGTNNNTYDSTVATVETPWLDLRTPATKKKAQTVDVAVTGAWAVAVGMDWVSGILDTVYTASQSSFDQGVVPLSGEGTHLRLRAQTTGAEAAVFSELVINYL